MADRIGVRLTHDTTTRRVHVDLDNAPRLDVTESWHSQSRIMAPDTAQVSVTDGSINTIAVYGARVRKDGTIGTQRLDKVFYFGARREIPEWVERIAQEVADNLTTAFPMVVTV